jgi:hypothetical protein
MNDGIPVADVSEDGAEPQPERAAVVHVRIGPGVSFSVDDPDLVDW